MRWLYGLKLFALANLLFTVSSANADVVVVTNTVSQNVPCAAATFSDSFASGDFSNWDAETDGDGDLDVNSARERHLVDDGNAAYIDKTSHGAVTEFWIRYQWMASAVNNHNASDTEIIHYVWMDNQNNFSIHYTTDGSGVYDGIGCSFKEDNTAKPCTGYSYSPSASTWQTIKIHWKAASGVGANDGIFQVYVYPDGGGVQTVNNRTSCDNDQQTQINSDQLGSRTSIAHDGANNYYLYWDNFEFRVDDCFTLALN